MYRTLEDFPVTRLRTAAQHAAKAADIMEKSGWTQGTYAKLQGKPIDIFRHSKAESPEAGACYCSLGAFYFAHREKVNSADPAPLHVAYRIVVGYDVVGYNDAAHVNAGKAITAMRDASKLLSFEADQREALERLDAVIAALKKGWCRHSFARDKNDKSVPAASPMAVCWCLGGAMSLANHEKERNGLLMRNWERSFEYGVPYFNDYKCESQAAAVEAVEKVKQTIRLLSWRDQT